MRMAWIAALIGLTISGPAFAETGKAALKGTAEGSPIAGTATLTPANDGLKIVVEVNHAPPGQHGLHIHDKGSCADGGNAAGGHYNPNATPHGLVTRDGMGKAHPGDLGNIDVKADGTGRLEATVPGLSLTGGKYNVADRAIILHEKADDFGQPTGNAGGRIACGTIAVEK